MINLHNTLFPCGGESKQKGIDISALDPKKPIEAVRFSDGWGIFNNKRKFWVNDEEKQSIESLSNSYKEFNPDRKAGETWHSLSPLELEVELSRQCNQRCSHCWNESTITGERLDKKILKKVLSTFREYGGQKILATGGEPLMYPDFEEIIEFCGEIGVTNFNLVTNGTLINQSMARRLSKYLDTVCVSIHGNNPEIHDGITLLKDSFERAKKGVKNLREEGVRVLLYFSVMESNFESIPKMFDLVKEWDCTGIRFKPLNHCGRGGSLNPMTSEGKRLLREYIEKKSEKEGVRVITSELFQKEYGNDPRLFRFVGCNALRTFLYLQSNGDLLSCNMVPEIFGNVKKDNIYDVWISHQASEFRDKRICKPTYKICGDCGGGCKSIVT